MIYLDEAATTPLRRDVLEAMWPYLTGGFGNPSSQHAVGQEARRGLDQARRVVAEHLGVRASEIVFTSGGTESDNAALKGISLADPRGRHVLVSAIEHPAVLEAAAFLGRIGYEVEHIPVDEVGLVAPETLRSMLRDDTTLVSIQYANNEVGTVQPIAEHAAIARDAGVPFHTDAVQAAGSLPLGAGELGVQALSLSGHKFGAPKGVGVLFLARGTPFEPLVHGGGQETDRRSGTENIAGAVGLAAAMQAFPSNPRALTADRDAFIDRVLGSVDGAILTGHRTNRLAGHASFVFPGTSGESVLVDLEARGIVCSSGSACATGSDEPSPVLTAMGFSSEVAQTAVRFTFGHGTSSETLATAASELAAVLGAPR